MKDAKRRSLGTDEELPEGMAHGDFSIGCEFTCGGRHWRCTDIGTRVIVAVCLDDHPDDPSWYNGPPYAVTEHIFDENDLGGCSPLPQAARQAQEEAQGS